MSKNIITKVLLFSIPIILCIIAIAIIFSKSGTSSTIYSSNIIELSDNIQENSDEEKIVVIIEETDIGQLIHIEDISEAEEPPSEVINNSLPYYIKVNYSSNVITIYTKDNNNKYTIPYKAMICSTGTYTPQSGVYTIPNRFRWLRLEGYVYGQYSTQITGNILFHSIPYTEKSNNTLEYWEFDKLGEFASAGCIRLTVSDAKWIYDNCENGTKVEFYSSSDLGPLGKPSIQKISDNITCRDWDPTDPDINNPWHNYTETENSNQINNINEIVNQNTINNILDTNELNNMINGV